jgi:hypothetical protein
MVGHTRMRMREHEAKCEWREAAIDAVNGDFTSCKFYNSKRCLLAVSNDESSTRESMPLTKSNDESHLFFLITGSVISA